MNLRMVKVGDIFRHFKGTTYVVADLAKDSENPEIIRVTYHPYGKPDERWSRPLVMFEETIERDGKKFRRFEPMF